MAMISDRAFMIRASKHQVMPASLPALALAAAGATPHDVTFRKIFPADVINQDTNA